MQRIIAIKELPRAVSLILGTTNNFNSDDEGSDSYEDETSVTVEEYPFNGQVYLAYRSYDLNEGKVDFDPDTGYVSVANDDKTLNLTVDTKGKKISELQRLVVMKDEVCIAVYTQDFGVSAETLIDDEVGVKILSELGIEVDELSTWQEVDEIV